MRILHVIPQWNVGGTERIVADLICSQSELDQPMLCVLGKQPAQGCFGIDAARYLNYSGSLRDLRGITSCAAGLGELIRESKAEVVHSHLWPAVLLATPAAADAGIGCVVHIHDSQPWLASGRLRDAVLRAICRHSMKRGTIRMIAVSNSVKNYTTANLPWPSNRIDVIYNGVDTEHFRPPVRRGNGKTLMIGSVGRLEPEKGFDHLIRAVARLKERGVEFQLVIAGQGSQREKLESLISELKLSEQVSLIGVNTNIRSFYENLDIFVLPSLAAEGLPVTILEAMSMGLPVVATDIAGASEVIGKDGSNGLLVPPGSADALVNAIEHIAESGERRNRLGTLARSRIETGLTHHHMAARIRQVYQELN